MKLQAVFQRWPQARTAVRRHDAGIPARLTDLRGVVTARDGGPRQSHGFRLYRADNGMFARLSDGAVAFPPVRMAKADAPARHADCDVKSG
jgi:hypothetical protein